MLEPKLNKPEARKNPRVFVRSLFPTETNISFRPTGGAFNKGVLLSISSAGVFIQAGKFPPIGMDLAMIFRFAGRQMQCQGRIIYHTPQRNELQVSGFGVKFTRMLSEDHHLIQNSIKEFVSIMEPF